MSEEAKKTHRSQIFDEPLPEVKHTVGEDIAAWTKEHEKKEAPAKVSEEKPKKTADSKLEQEVPTFKEADKKDAKP